MKLPIFIGFMCLAFASFANENVYIAPKGNVKAGPPVVDPNMGVVPPDTHYPQYPQYPYYPRPDVALDDVDPGMGVIPPDAHYPPAYPPYYPPVYPPYYPPYYPDKRPNMVYMPNKEGDGMIGFPTNGGAFMPPSDVPYDSRDKNVVNSSQDPYRGGYNSYNDMFESDLYNALAPSFSVPMPQSKIVVANGQEQKQKVQGDTRIHRIDETKEYKSVGVGNSSTNKQGYSVGN